MSASRSVPRTWSSPDDGWSGLPAHLMDSVFQGLVQSSTTGDKLPLQVPCSKILQARVPAPGACRLSLEDHS